MKLLKASFVSVLILSAFMLFFQTTGVIGQAKASSALAESSVGGSPAARAQDRKAMEKLKKMAPDEIKALDHKLAKALTLFYDGEYARALPPFREVSEQVETIDVMFWTGVCASKAGRAELAIAKLKKILAIDPGLHQARIELATVYIDENKPGMARRELETVMSANPSESEKMKVQKLLAVMEARKRFYPNVRISQSLFWDSNVNVAPNRRTIAVPTGGIINRTRNERELSDWVTATDLYGSVLFDPFDMGGFMWDVTGTYYDAHNMRHHTYTFTDLGISTGPWWKGENFIAKLPVGFRYTIYAHDYLLHTIDISPSFEYFITEHISLRGLFSLFHNSYTDRSDDQSNNTFLYGINPKLYFNERNDVISFELTGEYCSARDNIYTYNGYNMSISYLKSFPWDMEFYVRYKYSNRRYEDSVQFWRNHREDHKHNVYVSLTQDFLRYLFASLYFNWIDNESSNELYDYDKKVIGFTLGFKYD